MNVAQLVMEDRIFRSLDSEVSDELMEGYFLPTTRGILYEFDVFRLKHPSLRGYGLRFHEKWEVREFLRKGLSENEITSSEGYEKLKDCGDFPHQSAAYNEHRFYQRMGQKILGAKIPFWALKVVRENFDFQGLTNTCYIFDDIGSFNSRVKDRNVSETDIRRSIELFERTGWRFENIGGIFQYLAHLKECGEVA